MKVKITVTLEIYTDISKDNIVDTINEHLMFDITSVNTSKTKEDTYVDDYIIHSIDIL